jgi:hypothetical protein
MELEIVPFERVGSLTFGLKREKVRELLGSNFKTFQKSPWSNQTTDDYSVFGLHLYYTDGDELEFVEIFPPARPIFAGMNLLQKNVQNTLEMLKRFDPDPEVDEAGYTFHQIGIGLYIEGDKLEAVSVFSKGYYAKLLKALAEGMP